MKGNRLGLKLWEKNYVFSLALFVAAFYLCLFLIGKGALDQAMENERAAALHIHDLAARALYAAHRRDAAWGGADAPGVSPG